MNEMEIFHWISLGIVALSLAGIVWEFLVGSHVSSIRGYMDGIRACQMSHKNPDPIDADETANGICAQGEDE